jgi:type IV pilus assembly protein PilQ
MVDLIRDAEFDYSTAPGSVVLSIAGGGQVVSSSSAAASGMFVLQGVDFRRGETGQGRVLLSLDGVNANVAVNASPGILTVDVLNTRLPDSQYQTLDVVDFATPVQMIDVGRSNEGVRLQMSVSGAYEHLVYQSGTEVVIEVSETKVMVQAETEQVKFYEDKEYEGTRVTFNFQDIPVRSVLQLIADVSDLNLVVADNVGGNLTLRLTNVPWDQALDIILDARNLDKRENGNVIWIAPAADIAAREQQLLQALQDRRELEPLQTAMIVVNYAKAEELKTLIDESTENNEADHGGKHHSH